MAVPLWLTVAVEAFVRNIKRGGAIALCRVRRTPDVCFGVAQTSNS
jgi:hypothetical protein